MKFTRYINYTIQDFLEDDYFVTHIIAPNAESIAFWAEFKNRYPYQTETLDNAEAVIKAYRNQQAFTNTAHQDKVWLRIQESLQTRPKPVSKVFALQKILRIAAMLILVSGIGIWLYLSNNDKTVSTAFGELRTITLPDNSVVVLNGNTQLKYAKSWGKGPREVWVTGEAFFNVKHLNKNERHIKAAERFIVHCNDVNIEVLGTSFNVRNRHNKTNVGLVSGKIRLDYTNAATNQKTWVMMKPGDYVQYARKRPVAKTKLAEPQKLTQWTSRQLIFSNATLTDITEVLADDYGYRVYFSDPDLANLKIGGEINVPNVDELLETISTTLHVKIIKTENKISISNF